MKRSELIIPFFKILLTKPSVILKALYHAIGAENRKDYVLNKYGLKDGLPCIDVLDLLPGLNEKVDRYSYLHGTSLPIDIAILKGLAGTFKDCAYLEIGTWRGESIANVAAVAKECVSVSLSDDEMRAIGWGDKFIRMQRFFSKDFSNIQYITQNSRTFDFNSLGKKFDLIFIDGDHTYEGVRIDTQTAFKLLKDENSIIIWHDYAASVEMINWMVFAGMLDGTPKDQRSKLYHVSNSLCGIYTNKKFKISKLDYPTFPNKSFSLQLSAAAMKP
jgi:predicted O-methyltransferase YrrM